MLWSHLYCHNKFVAWCKKFCDTFLRLATTIEGVSPYSAVWPGGLVASNLVKQPCFLWGLNVYGTCECLRCTEPRCRRVWLDWRQGCRSRSILPSRMGARGVSLEHVENMENTEKMENMEMFSGFLTEVFSCSPTEIFSGSPTEMFFGSPTEMFSGSPNEMFSSSPT